MEELNAPVTRVTLMEDRGQVTRVVDLELPEGVSHWRIAGVAPAVVDKTVQARLGSLGRVVDTRVRRFHPTRESAPSEPAEARREREARLARAQSERALIGRELDTARKLSSQLLQEVVCDVAWGKVDKASWEKQWLDLQQWQSSLLEQRLELEARIVAERAPVYPRAGTEKFEIQAEIVLEIHSQAAGPAHLTVEYAVPGACWRPYHSAVLSEAEDRLDFRCDGCVWQNTGEDWQDVELYFSTQRTSLGEAPPELVADLLTTCKKSPETVVQEREDEIGSLAEPERQVAPSQDLPGIDDGGQALNLKGVARANLLARGEPVRVELFSFSVPTRLERVLMAEVCPEVVVKSIQANTAGSPLLAGPVDLLREGGLVGRSSILYVAPGETFNLGWGPDPMLRAQRTTEKGKEEKDDLLGSWIKVDHQVRVNVSNLGLGSSELVVTERIPVSELKQVEVVYDPKATSEGVTPDPNGFVTWKVGLGPRGRKELKLGYALRRRKEVVLQ